MSPNESLEKLMRKYTDELFRYNSVSKTKSVSTIGETAISAQDTVTALPTISMNNMDDEYITEVSSALSGISPSPMPISDNDSNTIGTGRIIVQVFTARRTMPVPNATVNIYYTSPPNKKVVETLITDEAGKTPEIIVPAKPKELSEQPNAINPFTKYNVKVSHPEFADVNVHAVSVFEGITAVLDVDMMPRLVAPNGNSNDYVVIEPSDL